MRSQTQLFETYRADVYSVADADPFGDPLAERCWAQEDYRFGFNGKEEDAEWLGGFLAEFLRFLL